MKFVVREVGILTQSSVGSVWGYVKVLPRVAGLDSSPPDKAVKPFPSFDVERWLTVRLWACFRTRGWSQNSRYVQSEKFIDHAVSNRDEAGCLKDGLILKQLWRVLCFVQMKDKLSAGFMTFWGSLKILLSWSGFAVLLPRWIDERRMI